MISSVGMGGSQHPKLPETEVVQKKNETEAETAKPSLQDEFDALLLNYIGTVNSSMGCGEKAQYYIDFAYAKLTMFVQEHPEFQEKLPQKHQAYNDTSGPFQKFSE